MTNDKPTVRQVNPLTADNTTLDRIDCNGHYQPGNCRWATPEQQAKNRQCSRYIEFAGERLCIRDWERKMGLSHGTVRQRLERGWPVETAICTPVRG